MKLIPSSFAAFLAVMILSSIGQAQVTKPLTTSGSIHDPAGAGNEVDGNNYYGTGNDDAAAEYGVATFNYTPADFGAAGLTDITQFDIQLSHVDPSFRDGASFALFLTTDDFDATFSGLTYDTSLFGGLDTAQFIDLSLLGIFPYDATSASGDTDTLSIPLSSSQEAAVISQVNSSSDFSVIITATNAAGDVTFSSNAGDGAGNGQPLLTINSSVSAVPEPTALGVLAIIGLAGLSRRRR